MNKINYCVDCGMPIKNTSTRCSSCVGKRRVFSEVTRKKMSNSRKGLEPWNKGKKDIYSTETKERMGIGKKGKKLAPETKAKMSVAQKGKIRTPETRAKIGAASSKRKHTPEAKAKIRATEWRGGRAASDARAKAKRRGFAFIPLNEKFLGGVAHHIDKEFVVYIPEEMHRSVYHSLIKDVHMEEINILALDFVYGD